MKDSYKIVHVPVTQVRKNPDNPRSIEGSQFKSLCRSLEESPELFEARPILASPEKGHFMILGQGKVPITGAGQNDLTFIREHRPGNDRRAGNASGRRGI